MFLSRLASMSGSLSSRSMFAACSHMIYTTPPVQCGRQGKPGTGMMQHMVRRIGRKLHGRATRSYNFEVPAEHYCCSRPGRQSGSPLRSQRSLAAPAKLAHLPEMGALQGKDQV